MTPPQLLITGTALLVLATLLGWPRPGLLWRLQTALRRTERVLLEDALKHLFDFEYRGAHPSLESVAGALGVSTQKATELLAHLERAQLAESVPHAERATWRLTANGRSDALRVIRIHRLWEHYLADETGIEADRWHPEAERLEHLTPADQVERLSSRLGHPRWDPHGDPIPTSEGEIAPPRGQPLTTLEPGRVAEIVHVEDEPAESYAQLLAEGLHPGMRVRLHELNARRVVFEVDANECVLAPPLAAHIAVAPLEPDATMSGPYEPLNALALGEEAEVVGFLPSCRGVERRRLLDLGLIPGTVVAAEIRSPGGDPTGYRIRGAVIALRSRQAAQIRIAGRRSDRPVPTPTGAADSERGAA